MSQNNRLQMTKVIKVPREKVFSAWKEPALLKRWFAPGALTIPNLQVDFKVGGAFSIAMEGEMRGQQTTGKMIGTYKEITPHDRIVFTCTGTWRGAAPETIVTIDFRDVPGGTEITLVQEGFADTNDCEGHTHGWRSSLEKLEQTIRGGNTNG